jgi:PAS domain S-box-containing protein
MINLRETKRIKESIDILPKEYQSFLEESKLAICITDESGKIFASNRNFKRVYECEEKTINGTNIVNLLPEDKQAELVKFQDPYFRFLLELSRKREIMSPSGKKHVVSVDYATTEKLNGTKMKILFLQMEQPERNPLFEHFSKVSNKISSQQL